MAPASLRTSTAEGKRRDRVLAQGRRRQDRDRHLARHARSPARPAAACCCVDLDLQFGDAAIMMGVEPEKTIYDLVMTTGELDPEKLAGYVIVAPLGRATSSRRRCAPRTPSSSPRTASGACSTSPRRPTTRSSSTRRPSSRPPRWRRSTAPTACSSSRRLDIPAVKNVKLTLQTLNLLHYPEGAHPPRDQPRHVEGRAGSQGGREGARPEGGVRDAGRPRGRRGRQPRRAGADVGAALRRREGARPTWPRPSSRARASTARSTSRRATDNAAAKRPGIKLRKAA